MSAEQIIEVIMGECYIFILPFKPPNWVLCHQLASLEDAIILPEVYTFVDKSLSNTEGMEYARQVLKTLSPGQQGMPRKLEATKTQKAASHPWGLIHPYPHL